MNWVVDTCVLLDILDEVEPFAGMSADALDMKSAEGALFIAPITYVELAPAFDGDEKLQDLFLSRLGIDCPFAGDRNAVLAAYKAWYSHILRKRAGEVKKRPIADVMIGACAMRKGGLITRNENDFRILYPSLVICNPVSMT